jgi:antitoxin VapB
MTEAIIAALEGELRRERERPSLADRLADIARQLRAEARAPGRDMTKAEVDDMWGH